MSALDRVQHAGRADRRCRRARALRPRAQRRRPAGRGRPARRRRHGRHRPADPGHLPGPRRGRSDRRPLHPRGVEPRPRAPAAHAGPLRGRGRLAHRRQDEAGDPGGRRLRGTVESVDADGIAIIVAPDDGSDLAPEPDDPEAERSGPPVAFADIERARTVFEWGPAPKPGGPKNAAHQGDRPLERRTRPPRSPAEEPDEAD